MTHVSPPRSAGPRARAAWLVGCALCALPATTHGQQQAQPTSAPVQQAQAAPASAPAAAATSAAPAAPAADVALVRSTLESWVETSRLISQEARDGALGRQTLQDRIDLVRQEIEAQRGRIGEAQQSLSAADEQRAALLADNERSKQASEALLATLVGLEATTREVLARLPDPLREKLRPLSQRLPVEGKAPLSLGERFLTVVGILNEVDKFQREITVTSEVRALADGSSAEVTAVYAGLGQGWYASADGLAAGVGSATPEGWVWTPAADGAAEIVAAIAILKNEGVARFVHLPVRLAH